MSNLEKTIAAQASAVGQGAVGLIRMSGPDCLAIITACTKLQAGSLAPRYAKLANILDSNGQVIDQVLITYFKGPASYTGEDVIEIACHGGMLVTRKVLQRLFECGAGVAEPGEFTKRAFLNGQMDLTQAEAVMDIISAGSELALKSAQEQLEGGIGKRVNAVKDRVIQILAHIEAYIDFPDEDISPDTESALLRQLNEVEGELTQLLATEEGGRLLREGIKTVIVGEPNVGKSSLLNTLLGYERAIVSDIAGTTRDTIEEVVIVGGMALRLIDTAGVRDSKDVVEQKGIERTNSAINRADLIIEVLDSSQPYPEISILGPQRQAHIQIFNKVDLGIHPSFQEKSGILYSCAQNLGQKELEETIVETFASKIPHGEGASLTAINARHREALAAALASLKLAQESISLQNSPEFTALELREVLTYLGEITGVVDTEDILGAIFSTFCLGK